MKIGVFFFFHQDWSKHVLQISWKNTATYGSPWWFCGLCSDAACMGSRQASIRFLRVSKYMFISSRKLTWWCNHKFQINVCMCKLYHKKLRSFMTNCRHIESKLLVFYLLLNGLLISFREEQDEAINWKASLFYFKFVYYLTLHAICGLRSYFFEPLFGISYFKIELFELISRKKEKRNAKPEYMYPFKL